MKTYKTYDITELRGKYLDHCYHREEGYGFHEYVYIVNITDYSPGGYDEVGFRMLQFSFLERDWSLDYYLPRMEYTTEYAHPKNFDSIKWEEVSFKDFIEAFEGMNRRIRERLGCLYNKLDNVGEGECPPERWSDYKGGD